MCVSHSSIRFNSASTFRGLSVSVNLTQSDLNALKLITNLAVNVSDTYVHVSEQLVVDVFGK